MIFHFSLLYFSVVHLPWLWKGSQAEERMNNVVYGLVMYVQALIHIVWWYESPPRTRIILPRNLSFQSIADERRKEEKQKNKQLFCICIAIVYEGAEFDRQIYVHKTLNRRNCNQMKQLDRAHIIPSMCVPRLFAAYMATAKCVPNKTTEIWKQLQCWCMSVCFFLLFWSSLAHFRCYYKWECTYSECPMRVADDCGHFIHWHWCEYDTNNYLRIRWQWNWTIHIFIYSFFSHSSIDSLLFYSQSRFNFTTERTLNDVGWKNARHIYFHTYIIAHNLCARRFCLYIKQ